MYKIYVKEHASRRDALIALGRGYLQIDLGSRGMLRVKQGQSVTLTDVVYQSVARQFESIKGAIAVTHIPDAVSEPVLVASAQLVEPEPVELEMAEQLPADEPAAVAEDEPADEDDVADAEEPAEGTASAAQPRKRGRRSRGARS